MDAPAADPGLNEAVADMLMHHVDGLSASQLSRLVGALGGHASFTPSTTHTQFVDEVPAADVSAALRIESERMRGFGGTSADWNVERAIFAQTASGTEASYEHALRSHILSVMHPGSPLARDPYSAAAALAHESFASAEKFRAAWYAPNNATLIVTGNVDPAALMADVRSDFGPIARRQVPAAPNKALTPAHASSTSIDRGIVIEPAVACVDEPGTASPDFAAAQILNDIVQSDSGALRALQIDGKVLDSSLSQILIDPVVTVECARATVGLGGDATALSITLRNTLTDYAAHGVSADAVAAAKKRELLDQAIDSSDMSSLARYWSAYVAEFGYQSPGDYDTAINKVTASDVDRVAKKYFDADRMALATVRIVQNAAPRAAASSPTATVSGSSALPDWAAAAARTIGAAPSDIVIPSDVSLHNGIRVITVPEPGTGLIQVYGRVKVSPEMEAPPGAEGVDLVLDRLFKAGPADMTRHDFATATDELGGHESAGSDFKIAVSPDDFDRGLQLLSDNELHPTLDPSAFARAQSVARDDAQDHLRSLGAQVSLLLARGMYPPADPTERVATPDSVAALTPDDVQSYFTSAFRPERTTVVVIGDVTPEKAAAEVGKFFGGWTDSSTPAPPVDPPVVPQNKAGNQFIPQSSIGIRYVMLGETLAVTPGSDDYEALNAGIEALGGTTWSSRFSRDVRDKNGLAVFVRDFFEVTPTRSTFSIVYACAPGNAAKVRSILTADIRSFQTTPLSADDLNQAKSLLLRQQLLQMGSPDGIAASYLSFASLGLPLNESSRRASRYAALTSEDVRSAFAKALRPDGFVDLEVGAQ
jgi:zinc protease